MQVEQHQIPDDSKKAKDGVTACFSESELWHFRFGHLPFEQLQHIDIPHRNKTRHGVC